jgi:NodT family efflux transporter outer membrane factor (OMF) lipoprotein
VPDAQLQIEQIEEQMTLARHALAALSAQPPQTLAALVPAMPTLQSVPLHGELPADLLGRRADISASRLRIEAALGEVGQARAQFYPNFNLTAFAGMSSIGLDRWMQSGSREAGIGPAIRLPIFDAGRLRANLRGHTAELDIAIESYNALVLDAVHEAADQISTVQSVDRQREQQLQAQAAAEAAFDLANQRYRAGLGNYLAVLSTESNVNQQRQRTVELRARALDARIGLIRALGGGYRAGADFAAHEQQSSRDPS